VEALIRWHHPERGLLEPVDFVEVAGEIGLVPELGGWAFREATQQAAQWVEEGWWGRRWMAVNLAPRQLADRRLLERIDDALATCGLDPTLVRVELTEDAIVDDSPQSVGFLEGLRQRGLGISVDDFGTGYSSLAYLKRLPIDALKLDQSFVAGLGEDGDDMVIAAAVIVMAQALGLRVVAEGVETRPQLEVLRAMGCDLVQGYLYSPALPPDELRAWVAEHG
jgi:EAL domain-containing protein (putative c-di-GMP-specific phosphodiesterase class I)